MISEVLSQEVKLSITRTSRLTPNEGRLRRICHVKSESLLGPKDRVRPYYGPVDFKCPMDTQVPTFCLR